MKAKDKLNILVTGSKGQLGLTFQKFARDYKNFNFTFTDIEELDITDFNQLKTFLNNHPFDAIINCAAYTAVDKAETEPKKAKLLNATAPGYLAELSSELNISLIHISTDFVFDGKKNGLYNETDSPSPLSIYGETKSEGENLILNKAKSGVIIRTSWLYSEFGRNFVKTIRRLAEEKDSINIVSDQVGTPTYASDLALAILNSLIQLLEIKGIEIFHYSNEGSASWYDFAKEIVSISHLNCKVNPIPSSEFPLPATRPTYSVMSKDKIKTHFNITIPLWAESLRTCIKLL